ncbi:MAG: single-stranded-DNA-specific exonuclease RecJ [Defluviitaleaceae bacterium]|nr:single-stranded-DNA-specific exonuclease RecJ [Defluviitaleaceae bacterium]
MKARWEIKETDADLKLMSQVLNISEITACVMANRGIRSKNAAISFLSPAPERLHSPMRLKDMQKALEAVREAIPSKKILIYGDYDADGITSTVILYKLFHKLGANCEYYIPHRIDEGYGLNLATVEKIAEKGVDLLIAVDNGISAVAEIKRAAELGMEIIVIDHHEPAEALPPAVAIIDPKQADCDYPFKSLCAAALAYKFAVALSDFMAVPLSDGERDELIVLAAIATICDIVPLVDENRIIAAAGLKIINANKMINLGIGSLIALRGYLEKPIDAFAVGFVVGPCLNATGRLASAELAVELLLSPLDEPQKRVQLASQLLQLNEARKKLTDECVKRAMEKIGGTLPKVLVLTDFEAHESVAGIVAGRIRDATCRPTILLTQGDGAVKGSARSTENYNIFMALYKNRHLFKRFGGHEMAAGLTLCEENIEPLNAALNEACVLTDDDFRPILHIDRELSIEEITLALSNELAALAPFGKKNDEPLFVSYGLLAENVRIINEKNTLIFTFRADDGRRLKGIAFGLNEKYAEVCGAATQGILDIAYGIETNVWNNIAEVQVRVRDFRIASGGGML